MHEMLKIFQVDAFAKTLFTGNPAAVVPLKTWLPDAILQNIASENNLSETAFFVPTSNEVADFHLRWFTPFTEVRLCGHATLASAHVLFNHLSFQADRLRFETKSGILTVKRNGEAYTLNFPADILRKVETPEILEKLEQILSVKPIEAFRGNDDFMVVLDSSKLVAEVQPNIKTLATLGSRGLIVTAQADANTDLDFVSRCFFPEAGVEEDPVTGSAHTTMTVYWSEKLRKNTLKARQISKRGGDLMCKIADGRVYMTGSAVTYLVGDFYFNA
jgi:PhzF family phenazine biosynthesis protein